MSRSLRNRKWKDEVILHWSGKSNKKDKTLANRKFRRKNRLDEAASTLSEEDEFKLNDIREVSNIDNFSSDGKGVIAKATPQRKSK